MNRYRTLLCFAVAALCAHGAHAGDEPLPRGAVARLVVPPQGEQPETAIDAVALSEHGDRLVAAVADERLLTWDVGTRPSRALPARHAGYVTGIAWSPSQDDVFATCSTGSDVRLWSFAAGVTLPLPVGRTHGSGRGPAFSPDGRWLLVGSRFGQFAYWEPATGGRVTGRGFDGEVAKAGIDYSIAWSPDGRQVAVGQPDGTLMLRPVAGGVAFKVPRTFVGPIRDIGYSPDQTALLVLGNTTLHSFSAPELSVPPKAASRDGRFARAAYSPTARLVAAGDADGRVFLLDPETLKDAAVAAGHKASVESLAFSGDGRRVATGDANGVVLVWDVAKLLGREPARVERAKHENVVPEAGRKFAFPPEQLRPGRAEGLADGERIEPYAGALPRTRFGEDEVRAVLVVDGTTGLPLPGATLSLFEETAGGPPGPAFARTTTDAHGIALAVSESGRDFGHYLVERDGFSPYHEFGWEGLSGTVALMPRPDAVGRLLDPYGAPLADAEVELFLGCGHGPTVRRATTAKDGTFRLKSCLTGEGNVVVYAPGCSAEYLDVQQFGRLGDEPVTFVLRPGTTVTGRVVSPDGWGVAGVGVKAGPERTITRTAADGAFTLRGVATGASFEIEGPGDVGSLVSIGGEGFDWARPSLPLTITVALSGDDPEFAAGPPVKFDTLVVDRDSGAKAADVRAVLVSKTTGYRYFPEVLDDESPSPGALRFQAPAGAYLLSPGSPFSSHAGDAIEVAVAAGQEAPLVVRAARQPRLALKFEGDPPSDADVEVVAEGAKFDIRNIEAPDEVHVPAQGRAAVVVRLGALQRAYPLGPERDGVREAVIAWPRAKRINVKGLVGKSVELKSRVQARIAKAVDESGTCVVETDASGAIQLEFDDDGDGRAVADVVVPGEPGATADVQVRRVPVTRVEFRDASGKPMLETRFDYEVWESGEGGTDEQGSEATGKTGSEAFSGAPAPSVIDLHPAGWAPRRVVVRRDGEQIVAWGDATLTIEVTDEGGKPIEGFLWFDGMLVRVEDGRAELRGADAGRRTILVGASRRQAQALDVNLARGASRTIRVALPDLAK